MVSGKRKMISIVTPCFNEEGNVRPLVEAVRAEMAAIGRYDYEHIFIDNASTDATVNTLKVMSETDSRLKVIVNCRNYGHARSPHYAMKQTVGDAVIGICADFQNPPALIPKLIESWENGFPIVAAVRDTSDESGALAVLRRIYYRLLQRSSPTPLLNDFTGFGLYDKSVIDIFRTCHDEEVYFRGFISELGLPISMVGYHQPARRSGKSKNNFWTLVDAGVAGFTAYGRNNMRLVTMAGLVCSTASMIVAFFYLIMKLIYWDTFEMGVAPLLIGFFFFMSVQLFVLGVVGEYVAAVIERVRFRPPLMERERVNFSKPQI